MLIDTHAHLNFEDFYGDGTQIAGQTLESGVWVINAGTNCEDSKKALEIANNFEEGVYASVGVHPGAVLDKPFSGLDLSECKDLAGESKVVAIGETGLDYHYLNNKKEEDFEEARNEQQKLFDFNLELSKETGKPLIIHCRDAYEDLIRQIREKGIGSGEQNGVAHCFAGGLEDMRALLDLGFYIGFTGIVTFSSNLDEVIEETPMEKILIETDCPFLAPQAHRGERNYPEYVKHVAEKIAQVKDKSFEEVTEVTTENAKQLFSI